jgi:hypothetical protein
MKRARWVIGTFRWNLRQIFSVSLHTPRLLENSIGKKEIGKV